MYITLKTGELYIYRDFLHINIPRIFHKFYKNHKKPGEPFAEKSRVTGTPQAPFPSSPPPSGRMQENKDGEDLQTAHQHGQGQHQLAQGGKRGKVPCWAHHFQTGANVAQAGQGGGNGGGG